MRSKLDDLEARIAYLERAGSLDYTALTDYSSTSTIVGWSAYTTKQIKYKMIGSVYFVFFNIAGTSNSTTTYFTLPITLSANWVIHRSICRGVDNGTPTIVYGRLPSGALPGNQVEFFTLAGAALQNTGTKSIEGCLTIYAS